MQSQLDSVEAALDLNNALINTAKDQKEELTVLFLKLPKLISEFESIRQDLLIALEKRKALVEAKENFQLEIAQGSVPWQIIRKPVISRKPILPSEKTNGIYGIIAGIIAGSIAVLIKDKLDNVYHSPDEAKERLKQNLLSNMPNLRIFNNENFANTSILDLLNQFKIENLNDKAEEKNNI